MIHIKFRYTMPNCFNQINYFMPWSITSYVENNTQVAYLSILNSNTSNPILTQVASITSSELLGNGLGAMPTIYLTRPWP